MQGTPDADLHKDLKIPHAELIIRKGYRKQMDSYSAFFEADGKTTTGLAGYLKERGFSQVFLVGLATDFCVGWSALDARKAGFGRAVIEDACRGIDADGSLAKAWQDMDARRRTAAVSPRPSTSQGVSMKYGLRIPSFALGPRTATLDTMGRYLRRAEDLGFDSAVTIDHLLLTPPAYACTWLEAMTTLAALAGVTRTIRLGTMVLVLPLRNPVYFAKEWATLDLLSGGRSILGIGVGWHEEEFGLMGVPYRERGPRTSEASRPQGVVGRRRRELRGQVLPDPQRDDRPQARPDAAPADLDRWRHPALGEGLRADRAQHRSRAQAGRPVRRHLGAAFLGHARDGEGRLGQGAGLRQRVRPRPRRASGASTPTSSGCSSPASGRSRRRPTSRSTPAWTSTTGRPTTCSVPPRRSPTASARASPPSTAASTTSSSTRSTGGSSSSSSSPARCCRGSTR